MDVQFWYLVDIGIWYNTAKRASEEQTVQMLAIRGGQFLNLAGWV